MTRDLKHLPRFGAWYTGAELREYCGLWFALGMAVGVMLALQIGG